MSAIASFDGSLNTPHPLAQLLRRRGRGVGGRGRCEYGGSLPRGELAARSHELAVEHDAVSRLLDAIAREERVPVSPPPAPATTRASGCPRGPARACSISTASSPAAPRARGGVARRPQAPPDPRTRRGDGPPVRGPLLRSHEGLLRPDHGKPRLAGNCARSSTAARSIFRKARRTTGPGSARYGLANRKGVLFRRHLDLEPMAVLEGAPPAGRAPVRRDSTAR